MSPTDWKRQYELERARLVAALGQITAGGIVEAIEPIGATSMPGLHGSACLDIALAAWPFPY